MIKRIWSETLTVLALAFLVAFSWPDPFGKPKSARGKPYKEILREMPLN